MQTVRQTAFKATPEVLQGLNHQSILELIHELALQRRR